MTWTIQQTYNDEWGRLQVIIGGYDRTKYRDVPTIVSGWSSGEPFDDKSCTLRFPAVTSFESINDLPFNDFDNVEIYRIDKLGNKSTKPLWEGFVASTTDDLQSDQNGLTVECLGALYQADFFIKTPGFGMQPRDSANSIAKEFNARSDYYGLRTKRMNEMSFSSTPTRNLGSWNKLLTGWTQELLSSSYTPPFMYDDEVATAINIGNDDDDGEGYWVVGDHGTFTSFGDSMPNYGSSTWWNAVFIHLFKHRGMYVVDSWYDRIRREAYYFSANGQVGRRLKNDTDSPGYDPWYGQLPYSANSNNWMAGHGLDSMGGYRLLGKNGVIVTYGLASNYGDAGSLPNRAFANGQVFPDFWIDMVRTPSGNGYYLLSAAGEVRARGDADPGLTGILSLGNTIYVAIEVTPENDGLYFLNTDGTVTTNGNATNLGSGSGGTLADAYRDIAINESGDGYALVRASGRVQTFGALSYKGDAEMDLTTHSGGNVTQYTMAKFPGRRPVIRTKDMWTTHITYSMGAPGVKHSLQRDRTQLPNTFYGEGSDGNNCKWRNTKYPNAVFGSVPLFPGYNMSTVSNSRSEHVGVWQRRMQQIGWPIEIDGVFETYDSNICKLMQHASGIPVTGEIDPLTWTVSFNPGGEAGNLEGAYIAPLALDDQVEPFVYNADGGVRSNNPNFSSSKMRIETYNNYGEKSSKREAQVSAYNELSRSLNPGYFGTITVESDPEEGISRFEIKAGQNVLYRNYRGEDVLFHIAGVNVDFSNQSVTLTVDSEGRDLMTLGAMLDRDRSIGDPPLKPTRPNSSSKQTQDTNVIVDCESKAGVIPWFATPGLSWNVIKVPLGEVGTVVKTEFRTIFPATPFSIAVFDRPVTTNLLNSIGDPETPDYWKDFPEDLGLIISWGKDGQMCGYHPGRESDGDDLTGRFLDSGSWNFWSSDPPWIWVGIWALSRSAISGRFYPGPDAGFNFASSVTVANPMSISSTA